MVPSSLSVPQITLSWLLRLRWGAALGQALTVGIAVLALGASLPLAQIALLVAAMAASNVALAAWVRLGRAVGPRTVAAVLVVDILQLSALLAITGGSMNPFSVLYVVHVALAAVVLGVRWAAVMVAASSASYAVLFARQLGPSAASAHHHMAGADFAAHLQGMWVAYTAAAALVAYFVARLASALREREAQLAEAQALADKHARLASITTMAAGAAHELGTPLATIAVVARELERAAEGEIAEDARLIRQEVDRCRAILQQLGARGGEAAGEPIVRVRVSALLREVVASLEPARALQVELVDRAGDASLSVPLSAVARSLATLVRNALDAHAEQGTAPRVALRADRAGSGVVFAVRDHAGGMPAEVRARVGEPFFTTKPPGSGLGLGVFLARSVVERLGGRLEYVRPHDGGTEARVTLAAAEGAA